MPDLHERVYALLCKKSKGSAAGKLRCSGILDKLRAEVVNDPVSLRKALIRLRADGLIDYAAGQHGEPVSGFMIVARPKEEIPQFIETWMMALEASRLKDEDKLALRPIGSALAGFSQRDMVALLDGLVRLRDNQTAHFGQQLFNVSAAYLLGSSKLLSALDSRALRSFGIELEQFASRPGYIIVGGNTGLPRSTVLIENPVSFDTAVSSDAAWHCLFVCTFGFGLSASTNDYGNQLAGVVESGSAHVLNRSHGRTPSLSEILSHPDIFFWGDLDIAAMQIFGRLAGKVPSLKLSALYIPMVDAVRKEGTRHPYVSAVGKEGQSGMITRTSREDIQEMLVLCSQFAVDQEIVTAEEITALAGRAYAAV